MKAFNRLFGSARSLRRRLITNIMIALSLCILLAGAVMIYEFYEHLEESLEDALSEEATEIISQIDPAAPQAGLNNRSLRFRGVEGAYRYTVFDGEGDLIAGGETSPDIWAQIADSPMGKPVRVRLLGERIGIAMRTRISGQDFIVLVSTYPRGTERTRAQMLRHEIEEQLIWVFLGVLIVIMAALLATRRALAPLGQLSAQAAGIGPADTNKRLDIQDAPAEFIPLIGAVNSAFDRLDAGYQAQRDFSSNVAHEIRTPLAVLRSSIDRIDDDALKASLVEDVTRLDQIFQQLVDLARADATPRSSFSRLDLHELAVGVAGEMAQQALRGGHRLSVGGASRAEVFGHPGLLSIALGNVIRNALQYAPAGTVVEVVIQAEPPGWHVRDRGPGVPDDLKSALFERFNRGVQANSKTPGSGIGLAIVKSVADSHGASVSVQRRHQGGSIFSFTFSD